MSVARVDDLDDFLLPADRALSLSDEELEAFRQKSPLGYFIWLNWRQTFVYYVGGIGVLLILQGSLQGGAPWGKNWMLDLGILCFGMSLLSKLLLYRGMQAFWIAYAFGHLANGSLVCSGMLRTDPGAKLHRRFWGIDDVVSALTMLLVFLNYHGVQVQWTFGCVGFLTSSYGLLMLGGYVKLHVDWFGVPLGVIPTPDLGALYLVGGVAIAVMGRKFGPEFHAWLTRREHGCAQGDKSNDRGSRYQRLSSGGSGRSPSRAPAASGSFSRSPRPPPKQLAPSGLVKPVS